MADQVSPKQTDPKTANTQNQQGLPSAQTEEARSSGVSTRVGQINREFQEKSALRHARDLGVPYVDIGRTPLNPDFLKIINFETAKTARFIPFFKVGKKVRVAVDDIDNAETKALIEKLKVAGYEISINLASSAGIDEALAFYESTEKYKEKKIIKTVEEKAIKTYEKEIATLADLPAKLETVTAEEGLNLLDIGAMKTKASDIHYEPEENHVVVRFRIDGVLYKVFEIKQHIYANISEQIKYKSKMRLNVTTIPQDGRYVFTFNERKIAVRVSSIPTPYGEAFVCRYLLTGEKFFTFEELGFETRVLTKLQKASQISQGMILITGPTGSGKSTTLYSLLAVMNTPGNKIITLEDPVEYYLQGVTQSQIDEKHNYTFAGGLRSVLRHDPDIIMIGEIRDLETAEVAAQAALTGHVLLSTLHTNSAIESIPRLINMGLPAFMVAPALNTVVAQRLVRKVCPECSTLEPMAESERKEFEEIIKNLKNANLDVVLKMPEKIPKIHGCDACSNTGYNGRIAIAEAVTINAEIKNLILNNSSLVDLIASARKEGMITMKEDGYMKVTQGLTTLEEVHRVTDVLM